MWLYTEIGFFSIIKRPSDTASNTLTVRARRQEDLDALRTKYLPELGPTQFDPRADYHYRATAPRERVETALASLVHDLRYANYKSRVEEVQGTERAIVYHEVWAATSRLQPQIPVIYASIGRRADVLGGDDGQSL